MKFYSIILTVFIITSLSADFKPSVDVFLSRYTSIVRGKRVGLITNMTGIDKQGRQTIDRLKRDSRVNLVALFAPEHGVRGNIEAGKNFNNSIDPISKLPIYSTYQANSKRPNPKDLAKVDVLIFHIQDLGCKTFTYIWTLAECMNAAATAKIPIIVLDVPSMAGFLQSDGYIREYKYKSFIGLYPTPYTYASTIGEMARYLKATQKINCKLYVVPMYGYRRGMSYIQTGMPWVNLSPNITSFNSACGYLITGPIGMMGIINSGLKHSFPFQVIAAPWIDGKAMARYLNNLHLGGVYFTPISYNCIYGRYKGQRIQGVRLSFPNVQRLQPVKVIVAILCYFRDHVKGFKWNRASASYKSSFDQALGSSKIREQIENHTSYWQIIRNYQNQARYFDNLNAKFRIYK